MLLLAAITCGLPLAPASADPQTSGPSLTLSGPSDSGTPGTRLMRAIWQRDHDAVAAALADGASPNYVAPFSEFKKVGGGAAWSSHPDRLISALSLAAQLGDLESMDDVIGAGADINLHARVDQSNLPATNRRATLVRGPTTGLDMTNRLIQKGYRPTAQDISVALGLRGTHGWEDWAAAVLDGPGVAERISAIKAGTDPEYQKLTAAQEADTAGEKNAADTLEQQVQTAQQAEQASKDTNQAIIGAGVGEMVCSKSGIYHTKYVAYVEKRDADRVQLRIVGAFDHKGGEFHAQEMHWDDIEKWTPCLFR